MDGARSSRDNDKLLSSEPGVPRVKTFDELARKLTDPVDVDLHAAYDDYRREAGTGDLDLFVDHLFQKGLIDSHVYLELASSADVAVTQVIDVLATTDGQLTAAPTAVRPEDAVSTAVVTRSDAPERSSDEATPAAGAGRSAPAAPSSGDRSSKRLAKARKRDRAKLGPRYSLLGVLGAGAMGKVHVARDIHLGRKVAFKRLLPDVAGRKQAVSRFVGEMQITAQLEHPNVVPIYGLEVAPDGTVAYAMKLVQGLELSTLLKKARKRCEQGQPLDDRDRIERRLEHFLRLCDAVAFAHSKGVVHRDLKPANIMIGRYNEVYLMDWGVARPIGSGDLAEQAGLELGDLDDDPAEAKRTRVGAVLGTPTYMSPEQAAGRNDELDERSDLYSLGLILQEVVTLQRAMAGGTIHAVLAKAQRGEKKPLEPLLPGTSAPRELRAIIAKATARKPEDRYRKVGDFAEDLRRYLRGDEIAAERDNLVQALARWIGKHRMTSLALLAAILLVAGVAIAVGATLVHEQGVIDQAHQHERRLTDFLSRTAMQSHRVDSELRRYEAELEHLVGAAEQLLAHAEASELETHFAAAFSGGPNRPEDLGPSSYYGRPVSVLWPVFHLAPGVDRALVEDDIHKLAWLRPVFLDLMLDSHHDDARQLAPTAQRQLIVDHGMPVHRVFVTLANGVHVAYPGMNGYAPSYDPTKQPYYALAARRDGLRWGKPYQDVYGHGLVVPCSAALYDDSGRFRGVAGIEVSLGFIVDELLDIPDLGYLSEAMLLRRDGTVLVRKSHKAVKGQAEGLDRHRAIELRPFPIAEVVAALQAGVAGYYESDGAERIVVAYHPLDAENWFYVAQADADRLFGSEPRDEQGGEHPATGASAASAEPVRSASTPAAPGSATAASSATATATAGPAAEMTVELGVSPPFARVTVNGKPRRAQNGRLKISGAVGSTHTVEFSRDGVPQSVEVTITEKGPKPSAIVAGMTTSQPRPPPEQPSASGPPAPTAAPESPLDDGTYD